MKGQPSQPTALDHVSIGQIVAPHGLKGTLRVKPLTDFRERFEVGRTVFLNGEAHKILGANWHKDQLRLTLSDISNPEAGETLRWEFLTVPKSELPVLDEDEFMTEDLIGLNVITADGRRLGQVTDVNPNPAHDILVVGDVLIPMVKEFIKMIDFDSETITVQLIPGMGPGEDAEEVR